MMQPHSLTGIVLGAVAAWAFGAIYYSALSRPWLAAQGKTLDQARAERASKPKAALYLPFILHFLGALLMGLVLYGILTHTEMFTARAGAISGGLCWLGFVLTTGVINNAYENRRWSLTAIDAAYWLIALVFIGAIVGWIGP